MQVAGGFAAIGVAVLLMLPPTKPVTTVPTPHAFGKVQPPAPLPAVYPDYAPLPPAPPVDAAADNARSTARGDTYDGRAPSSVPPPVPMTNPGGQFYADADPDAQFDQGYRWAERRALDDPNRCMRWPDSPHVEGCLAYIRDAGERDDPPDPDEG